MVAGPATASHQGGEAVAEAALAVAGLGLESVRLSVRPSILPLPSAATQGLWTDSGWMDRWMH